MAKKILKWELEFDSFQSIMLQKESEILDVQMQRNKLCMWVLCDPEANKEPRRFAVYPTGMVLPEPPGRHIATFQIPDQRLVFHVFEAEP